MIQTFYELSIMYRYGKIKRAAKIAYKTRKGAKREMNRQFEKFHKEYNIPSNGIFIDKDEESIMLHSNNRKISFCANIYEDVRYPIHEDDEEISDIGGTLYRVDGHPDTILRLSNEAFIGKDWAYNIIQGDPTLIKGNNIIKLSYKEEIEYLTNKGG